MFQNSLHRYPGQACIGSLTSGESRSVLADLSHQLTKTIYDLACPGSQPDFCFSSSTTLLTVRLVPVTFLSPFVAFVDFLHPRRACGRPFHSLNTSYFRKRAVASRVNDHSFISRFVTSIRFKAQVGQRKVSRCPDCPSSPFPDLSPDSLSLLFQNAQ